MMKCYNCDLVIPPGEQLSNDHPTTHATLDRCLELLIFVKDQLLVSLKDAEGRAWEEKQAKNDIWTLAEKDQENHQAEIVSLKSDLADAENRVTAAGKAMNKVLAITKEEQANRLSRIASLTSQLADAGALAKKHQEHFLSRIDAFRVRIAEVEEERDELRKKHNPVMFLRCSACNMAARVSDLKVDGSGFVYLSCRNCKEEIHIPHEMILSGLAQAWGHANERNNKAIQLAKQLNEATGHIRELEKKLHPLVKVKLDQGKLDPAQLVECANAKPSPIKKE